MPNLKKWVNLSFLACGLLVWVFFRDLFAAIFEPLGWNRADWVVSPADLAGIALGLVVFIILVRSAKANTFLTEVLAELSKVTWPTRKETILSTGVVSVMVAIASLLILLFSSVWGWAVENFLYR